MRGRLTSYERTTDELRAADDELRAADDEYRRGTSNFALSGEVRATLPYPYCFVVGACWEQRSEFLPGGTKGRSDTYLWT